MLKKRLKWPSSKNLSVAARGSSLSRAQVDETGEELRVFFPEVSLAPHFVTTYGDRDQKSSLRTMEKTDFFTREVDKLVIDGTCRVAVHSAKDLPESLSSHLKIVALTRGVDPSDVIVLRDGESLASLSPQAVIGTSSVQREERVRSLREDLVCADIRGTIERRLEKLQRREVDGVVVARAALLRLQLTHLNSVHLPGESTPLQGRLAVVALRDDHEMETLFSVIDAT